MRRERGLAKRSSTAGASQPMVHPAQPGAGSPHPRGRCPDRAVPSSSRTISSVISWGSLSSSCDAVARHSRPPIRPKNAYFCFETAFSSRSPQVFGRHARRLMLLCFFGQTTIGHRTRLNEPVTQLDAQCELPAGAFAMTCARSQDRSKSLVWFPEPPRSAVFKQQCDDRLDGD